MVLFLLRCILSQLETLWPADLHVLLLSLESYFCHQKGKVASVVVFQVLNTFLICLSLWKSLLRGTDGLVQWARLLPCRGPSWLWLSAPQMNQESLSGVIPDRDLSAEPEPGIRPVSGKYSICSIGVVCFKFQMLAAYRWRILQLKYYGQLCLYFYKWLWTIHIQIALCTFFVNWHG